MTERTYLELSEDSGSHERCEVVVDGITLTIRDGKDGACARPRGAAFIARTVGSAGW